MKYAILVLAAVIGLGACAKKNETTTTSTPACTEQFIQDYNDVVYWANTYNDKSTVLNRNLLKGKCAEFTSKYAGVSCGAIMKDTKENKTLNVTDLKTSCDNL